MCNPVGTFTTITIPNGMYLVANQILYVSVFNSGFDGYTTNKEDNSNNNDFYFNTHFETDSSNNDYFLIALPTIESVLLKDFSFEIVGESSIRLTADCNYDTYDEELSSEDEAKLPALQAAMEYELVKHFENFSTSYKGFDGHLYYEFKVDGVDFCELFTLQELNIAYTKNEYFEDWKLDFMDNVNSHIKYASG